MNCPACSTLIVHGDRFCSSCGQALDELPTTTKEPTPHVARATTSVDYLHGRFSPGSILGRYRIVERVGKGGMGEVYHADDLTLNQPVALKFLPEELAQNERALKRFRSEVRTARQISHPNVCRVYDIGEVEGLQFLSMEYIQGEDLRSLLRRIDHLPPGKAVEIAVQLASGLAAAHDKGVLHRDLKPANVMIDERGQARIADFGLAALAGAVETRDIGSGTPSYMAPEQRAGKEVTERSDIYSLGLVLYEAFTGRRAFEGLEQKDTAIAAPSSFVDGIDPALERIILQCLEREPKKRPSSALAIRAALPGGDPLAAAVARGETPAPAIVAEAGAFSGLSPAVAWTCLLSVLFSLAGTLWIAGQSRLSQIVPLPESPAFLIADARSILEDLGYPTPQRDSTYGFSRDVSYIDDLMSKDRSSTWWELLERGEPSVIRFWYRESPQNLVPHRITEFFPAQHDPPDSLPGMVSIELDTRGRLRRLEAVPPDLTDSADDTNEPDWGALFAAASLDPENFSPVEPRWFPPRYADRRAAWDGIYPDAPEIPIRVEAASFHGRAFAFRIVEPWSAPAAGAGAESPWVRPSDVVPNRWASVAHVGLHLLFMFTLALLARRNLKLGGVIEG